MAMLSLHDSVVGKSAQAQPFASAARLDYTARAIALTRVDALWMQTVAAEGIDFLRERSDLTRRIGVSLTKFCALFHQS
ncbi:MAG: hypothetical protein ACK50Q_08510 [Labrys sp. (in: a-proteobacteria)]